MSLADKSASAPVRRSNPIAFTVAGVIGALGGLIGLGGAEFRLPVLINLFKFRGLEAVILNKAISLAVVASALPFRAATVPLYEVGAHWPIIVNLLAGSFVGAWVGAEWATRLKSETLYHIIATLLVVIAGVLLFAHDVGARAPLFTGWVLVIAGVSFGFVIGIISSLLGVAGGEFLIPTIVLVFGADAKLAGSLSLAVSLPTMLVGFARYSRDRSFSILRENGVFFAVMVGGSIVGTFVGGLLLGTIPSAILLPMPVVILIVSAFKVWRHA
jgi:uncharacterized protein